jgi:hypothetical protein
MGIKIPLPVLGEGLGEGLPAQRIDKDTTMRFMVIVKATKDSEAGIMPSEQLLTEMGKYNEELVKAGVMEQGMVCTPVPRARGFGSLAISAP